MLSKQWQVNWEINPWQGLAHGSPGAGALLHPGHGILSQLLSRTWEAPSLGGQHWVWAKLAQCSAAVGMPCLGPA